MNELDLPPLLSHLRATSRDSTGPNLNALVSELDIALGAIKRLAVIEPESESLKELQLVQQRGFTTGSSKACPCCGRPY